MKKRFEKIGVHIPSVLLPNKDIDLTKWAVVACDQYTSQPEYWAEADRYAGSSPSALRLILPEVYLDGEDSTERINNINSTMDKYLSENILVEQSPGFILIDRQTSHAPSRKGIVMAVDLEKYDYSKGSQSLIRATEGTVIERLPPRIRIRENAAVELPHIMVLIDDPDRTVIEPLFDAATSQKPLYDFELMLSGGHIRGYKLENSGLLSKMLAALEKLANPELFQNKYGVGPGKGILLFAVGDGNHSLASAKALWEKLKNELPAAELENHPARYALVEVVNVHDAGLEFEPIHRVVFNIDSEHLLDSMADYFKAHGSSCEYREFDTEQALKAEIQSQSGDNRSHQFSFVTGNTFGLVKVRNPRYNLEVGTLQSFLDEYIKKKPEAKIDYIHGEDVTNSLSSKAGNMGFLLPVMNKNELFKTVILDGVLPRKTFSMGEADEKRFYLECRKIRK